MDWVQDVALSSYEFVVSFIFYLLSMLIAKQEWALGAGGI